MLALFAAALQILAPAAPPQGADVPGAPAPQTVLRTAELWRGARVGMTAAQVATLFPYGRAAAAVLVTRPPVANAVTGAAAGWAVEEQVFGHPALATYYFDANGLLEVVVGVRSLRLRHTRDNVETARAIRTGLVQYYGRPKICLDTDRRGFARLDCRWVTRSVQVGLSYTDYGGLEPELDVAVRALPRPVFETGAVFTRHGAGY